MTAVNQFLPFATGTSANVLTPAQYQALSALGPGFTTGILPSANLNTVLRQASFVSAMIGQFIVDKANVSALDDGNIAELETNFQAAVKAYVISQLGGVAKEGFGLGVKDDGSGNLTLNLADGSLRLTGAGLQGNEPITPLSGTVAINGNPGTSSHFANFIGSGTLNLAQTATLWNGFCFSVFASGGLVTLNPNAADGFNGGAGGSYTMNNGQTALFITDGNGNWWVLYLTTPASVAGSAYNFAYQSGFIL